MHTLSSARRTCIASASAVECTATVGMPSSLQARSTRSAISPRLAMRIFSNMSSAGCLAIRHARPCAGHPRLDRIARRKTWMAGTSPAMTDEWSLDDHQRLAELDGLTVLEQDLGHGAGARRRNLVERLHRLDDEERVADLHAGADVDERLRA